MRDILGFLALAGLAMSMPAPAQDVARMDSVVRADADRGEFMGAVLVARDGAVLLDRGYGSANLEWRVANDGATRFRLASLTKQFTAAAVLLLAERGRLKLDDPVATHLPDVPAAWGAVTVRHLLAHTSGIANLTALPDHGEQKTRPATLDALIARFRDRPLEFAPGTRWKYSNSGYILLTAIIERAGGQPYAAFVADHIFKPLDMADSGYDSHAAIVPRRAAGYSRTPAGLVNADYIDMTIPAGAGGLYSTTRDLLKWQQGLFGGGLLKPESLRLLTTPVRDGYALGLAVATQDGTTTIQHSGGIEGFNTWLGYDPARKLTVAVLGNLNGPAPARLGNALMTLARGGTVILPSERRAVTLPAATLKDYEGVYEVGPAFAFTVRVAGDGVTVQATGQDPVPMFAEAADRFFLKIVDAQIAFTRDAGGRIASATLTQNGNTMVARRK